MTQRIALRRAQSVLHVNALLSGWYAIPQRSRAQAAPYWLTAELERGAFWGFVHMPRLIPRVFLLPWESVEFHADLVGDELSLTLNLGAGFNTLLALMTPEESLSSLSQWVHNDSPLALKLSLDPKLIRQASILALQLPWLKTARRWVESGWGGEVLLTFDGGIDHPVLLFNLQPHPWSGEQLSDTISSALSFTKKSKAKGRGAQDEQAKLGWWAVPHSEGEPWYIPTMVYGGALMVALFPADLKRRARSNFSESRSPHLLALERRGVSGGMVDPALFEWNEFHGGRIHRDTLWPALYRLWSEGGSGLVDVPPPLAGEEGSLAEALSRLSRFEEELLVNLFSKLTDEETLFLALTDLASLTLQLTEMLQFTAHSYAQEESGGSGLSIELTWSIL